MNKLSLLGLGLVTVIISFVCGRAQMPSPSIDRSDRPTVNGRSIGEKNGALELPADARTVKFVWERRARSDALGYMKTVDAYKPQYRKHYDEYLRTGTPIAQ
jgi:hypothetical protein